MLKKFISGLVFGAGFTIAFVVIMTVLSLFVLPQVAKRKAHQTPQMKNPKTAELLKPVGKNNNERDFAFFSPPEDARMKIPESGGILAMAPVNTPSGAKRQHTFQLWLTQNELWKISTQDGNPLIEQVQFPETDPVKYIEDLMDKSVGMARGRSQMVISRKNIESLKNGKSIDYFNDMNGEVVITTEGVVIFLPNTL